jgi:hypothetical protein
VGRHPVHESLLRAAREIAETIDGAPNVTNWTHWDAFQFVDYCQRSATTAGPPRTFCLEVMRREWELLFDFCYRRASGADAA